jgi:hypothetical protein
MISASKTTFSLNNLKILRPKVTIILRICLRSFVNLHPVVPFYDIKGDGKMLSILTPRLLLFALFTHEKTFSFFFKHVGETDRPCANALNVNLFK